MSFQVPITISEAMENIENHYYLLPAIQREFVWNYEKVERLFDSIMQNYPISSFLFWRIEGETKNRYKYYSFLKEYRELFRTQSDEFGTEGLHDFYAVLDGQQRLTSLYIGLKGSYAHKKPRVFWKDTEDNIPTRYLYLNIESAVSNQEDGRIYDFRFLTLDEFEFDSGHKKWFKVGKILDLKDNFEFNKYLDTYGYKDSEFTYKALSTLHNVIHSKQLINYFLEKEQNIEKALNIFIRINSGGEPLDYSDLLISIAIAHWENLDAKKEFQKLIESIRDEGFFITKDFILRVYLVLHSDNIKFRVSNFQADSAKQFEEKWDEIKSVIKTSFALLRSFGFTENTLTSKNAIIPIIYYLYHKDIYKDFVKSKLMQSDRRIIQRWINLVLLQRVFGRSSDTILSLLRNVIKSYLSLPWFPYEETVSKLIDSGYISTDEKYLSEILYTQKDDNYTFSILSLLYPHLDYKNNDFHKDHIHPESCFNINHLTNIGITNDDDIKFYLDKNHYNSILNLQLIDSRENESKKDKTLVDWVTKENIDIQKQLIPNCLRIEDFKIFIEQRKTLLLKKLKDIL
ncbi:MAG TPA: DUF262 domain-containing protein [Clostridia bacterium]|nr:DUF262 domain-containing protein [Clostridia bacterium]